MRHVGDGFQWISSGSCCWCWCWPSNRRQKGWRTSWDINTNNRLAGIPCPRHFTKFMAIGRKRKEDKSVLGYEGIFMPSSGIQPACSSEWAKKRPDARYVLANSTAGWMKRHRTPNTLPLTFVYFRFLFTPHFT